MECVRSDVDIYFEEIGPADGPTLVLIAGLGEQIGSVEFPDEHCALFVERGFRVIRMDNRDNGFSLCTPPPGSDPDNEPQYSYLDMADDVAAVIEASGAGSAHVIGASMGGFLARWAAVRHPDKVASLTVVMSGCAAGPDEPGPQVDQEMIRKLRDYDRRREREEAIQNQIDKWRWLWGTHYTFDEGWIRERVTSAHDRAYRPEGVARNLLAGVPGLWDAQRTIRCPTLVFHGELDPCFGVEHAMATASQIPKSTLWVEPGMGHTMHQELWSDMVDRIERVVWQSGYEIR